jgi:hypothetical protein
MLKEVSWMAISTLFNRVASSACSLSTIGNWRRALQQHVDVAGLADIVGLENANCLLAQQGLAFAAQQLFSL